MSEVTLTSSFRGAKKSSKALSGLNVQTAPVHVGTSEYNQIEHTEAKNVEVGVFMDGTWNNRNNTAARREYKKSEEGANPENLDSSLVDTYRNYMDDDNIASYENDYSNIARMYPHYKEEENESLVTFHVYVEGVGTKDFEKDTKMGGGFGMGNAGIPKKMEEACEKIVEKLNKNGITEINNLTIDVFGFSRGAAAARNLVHEVFKPPRQPKSHWWTKTQPRPRQPRHGHLGKALEDKDISLWMLTVRFVGLYDTVSAYGLDLIFDSDDDTEELHLDAVRKARHTLQLTAADEYRDNFALTNIKSAILAGSGEQYALPGAHADVGGCYVDGQKEEKMFDYHERDYLLAQGWYTPDQLRIKKVPARRAEFEIDYEKYVTGTRTLPNTYSYIPLTIMADKMMEKELPLYDNDLRDKYPIPPDLSKAKKRIFAYVFGGDSPPALTPVTVLKQKLANGDISPKAHRRQLKDSRLLMNLRNAYLHFSSGLGVVNKPNRTGSGRRKRKVING